MGKGKAAAADTHSSIQEWQNNLATISFLKDAAVSCVRVGDPHSPPGGNRDRAQSIMDIMDHAPLTAKLVRDFKATDGGMCFADFQKKYPNTGMSAMGALYFPTVNALLVNTAAEEGCVVAASIHETHHAAQKNVGITAPVRDLTIHEQDKLILAVENDAHVVQAIGSWMLGQPSYASPPYTKAQDCMLRSMDSDQSLYMGEAARMMENISAHHPDWIADGRAARRLYEQFSQDKVLSQKYKFGLRAMYDCSSGDQCFYERMTLDQAGIDLTKLGRIHYPVDYTSLPVPH